jgi:hypothetical protein
MNLPFQLSLEVIDSNEKEMTGKVVAFTYIASRVATY